MLDTVLECGTQQCGFSAEHRSGENDVGTSCDRHGECFHLARGHEGCKRDAPVTMNADGEPWRTSTRRELCREAAAAGEITFELATMAIYGFPFV
jgi:hypothetical protein